MRYLVFIFVFTAVISCNNQQAEKQSTSDPVLEKIAGKDYAKMIEIPTTAEGKVDSNKMARIKLFERVYDFDTIFSGDEVSHSFDFENIGVKALYILETNSSCGCTVPSYSKAPIMPGEKGTLSVNFNSTGKYGLQNRKIVLITNAYPSEEIIRMKGFVQQKD